MTPYIAVVSAVLVAFVAVVGLHVAARFLGRRDAAESHPEGAAAQPAQRERSALTGTDVDRSPSAGASRRREALTVRVLPLLVVAAVGPMTALLLLWGPALHAPGGHARAFLTGLGVAAVLAVGVLHALRRGEGSR